MKKEEKEKERRNNFEYAFAENKGRNRADRRVVKAYLAELNRQKNIRMCKEGSIKAKAKKEVGFAAEAKTFFDDRDDHQNLEEDIDAALKKEDSDVKGKVKKEFPVSDHRVVADTTSIVLDNTSTKTDDESDSENLSAGSPGLDTATSSPPVAAPACAVVVIISNPTTTNRVTLRFMTRTGRGSLIWVPFIPCPTIHRQPNGWS